MLCQKGRDGGRATISSSPFPDPADGAAVQEPGGNGLGPGVLQTKGSLPRRERGRTGPEERRRAERGPVGPGLPLRQVRERGRGSSTGAAAAGGRR